MSINAPRIKIERGERKFRVVVGSAGGMHAWLLATFLFATTSIGGFTLARACRVGIVGSAGLSQLLVISLVTVLLGVGIVTIGYRVVWQLFGSEEIVATPELTTIVSRALVFGRRLTVKTSEIKRVDWTDVPLQWVRGWRRSFFVEMDGSRIELRSQLSLVEANQLRIEIWESIHSLQQRVEERGYRD